MRRSRGERATTPEAADRARAPREHYDHRSYAKAVRRAAIKAGVKPWWPHQLKHKCGTDVRKSHHTDHLGIHPQRVVPGGKGPALYSVGLLVPVGRITTKQMRAVADLADRYGTGDIRVTVQQNLVIPNIPDNRLGALTEEAIFQELPHDPSPIMRGLFGVLDCSPPVSDDAVLDAAATSDSEGRWGVFWLFCKFPGKVLGAICP